MNGMPCVKQVRSPALRFHGDLIGLMAESEEELKSLLMKVKEESEKIGLKLERLLLNHTNTPGFLAPGGEEFNPGPETRLDRSELLCRKVLLKYKGDRESF